MKRDNSYGKNKVNHLEKSNALANKAKWWRSKKKKKEPEMALYTKTGLKVHF